MMLGEDPRDRLERRGYRVVAPHAKRSGSRTFLNGVLVIEKRNKDSKGDDRWDIVREIRLDGDADEFTKALYVLLGGDAE